MWFEDWGVMNWGTHLVPMLSPLGMVLLALGFMVLGKVVLSRRTLKPFATIALTLVAVVPVLAFAVTVPNAFVNGTVADANEVNANFVALEDAVNDTSSTVEELKVEQQTTSETLEDVTQDLTGRILTLEQIAGAPAICDSTCERGVLKIHFADGNTFCPRDPSLILHCDPYQCSADNTGCMETCQDNFDCRVGSVCCTTAECLFAGTLAQCLPDVMKCNVNTLQAPDGDQHHCGNHRCVGSTCRFPCYSTAACISGTACDAEGACVIPPTP